MNRSRDLGGLDGPSTGGPSRCCRLKHRLGGLLACLTLSVSAVAALAAAASAGFRASINAETTPAVALYPSYVLACPAALGIPLDRLRIESLTMPSVEISFICNASFLRAIDSCTSNVLGGRAPFCAVALGSLGLWYKYSAQRRFLSSGT